MLEILSNFSQKNVTMWLKSLSAENGHTKTKSTSSSIEIQKVLQNVKKYCEINDDNSDEQIIEYITNNSPIGNHESVIYGSKQIEIEGFW